MLSRTIETLAQSEETIERLGRTLGRGKVLVAQSRVLIDRVDSLLRSWAQPKTQG